MITTRLVAPRRFEIEEAPTPEPKEGEVLLRVSYVAICGSEFAPYLGLATQFPLYEHKLAYPRMLGHEASGVIEALGPGVTGFKVGQRVMPRRARFATHAICSAAELTPIPDNLDQKKASLGLMTQETYYICRELAKIQPQDRVLIIGAGSFGMLCLEHVREIGCKTLVAADLYPGRLALARRLGASHTINAAEQDVVEAAPALLGELPTVVIETSGQARPMKQAFKLVQPEGKLVLAGRPHAVLENFEIEDIFHRMMTVYGAKTPPAGYDLRYSALVLDLIAQNKIHGDDLITHEYPLREIGPAFETATNPRQGGLKVVVNCAGD
jgi:threonine dehydrogenase-like Zn-dependent dehydrogenase